MRKFAVLVFEHEEDETDSPFLQTRSWRDAFHSAALSREDGQVARMTFYPTYASTSLVGSTILPGPFSSARTAVTAIAIIEAAHLDQAMEMAKRLPCAPAASALEIRPLLGFEAGPT